MAKVLLVDTNFSSRPIFDAIEQLGHEVHVVGGNPVDCLAKTGARYWHLNYADTDALQELVTRERFDYLVPGCTDQSYTSCAVISKGRFPGISSLAIDEALNQKDRFRALAQKLNLPVPKVQWQDRNSEAGVSFPDAGALHWPLVVKPVDGFSGKGVAILFQGDAHMLRQSMETARTISARGHCLIEDYIQGQLHSHSAFLQNRRVVHDVFVEESGTANHFVVDTSRVLPNVPTSLRHQLRRAIETLANALELTDGLIHTQFILNGTQPWLIEMTRRCPGDLYSQLVELSGGVDYVQRYVRPFLGLQIESPQDLPYVPIMRHTLTVPAAQSFSHLHFFQAIQVERWVSLSLTGDRLQPSPASRIGILFARATDEMQLQRLYEATLHRRLYEVVA